MCHVFYLIIKLHWDCICYNSTYFEFNTWLPSRVWLLFDMPPGWGCCTHLAICTVHHIPSQNCVDNSVFCFSPLLGACLVWFENEKERKYVESEINFLILWFMKKRKRNERIMRKRELKKCDNCLTVSREKIKERKRKGRNVSTKTKKTPTRI